MKMQEMFYSENCWNLGFAVFQASLAKILLK